MFKSNWKNFVAIGVLALVLAFGVAHFGDICAAITNFFRL